MSRVAHYAALLLCMRHVERSAFVRALVFAPARPVSSCSLPQITSLDYCFSSVTLHILTGLSTLFSSLVTCVEPSLPISLKRTRQFRARSAGTEVSPHSLLYTLSLHRHRPRRTTPNPTL